MRSLRRHRLMAGSARRSSGSGLRSGVLRGAVGGGVECDAVAALTNPGLARRDEISQTSSKTAHRSDKAAKKFTTIKRRDRVHKATLDTTSLSFWISAKSRESKILIGREIY